MNTFDIHEAHQGDFIGGSLQQILVPEPDEGMVRVPLLANIQNDGGMRLSYTCHGILRRTASAPDPGWTLNLSSPSCILWTRELLPDLMVGGEWFVEVPTFRLPRGFEIYVEWNAPGGVSGGHAHRTRCVSVQVPAASVDWSRVGPAVANSQFLVT